MSGNLSILLVAGYKPANIRRTGGPNAVSSPLIDAFALLCCKYNIKFVVISSPFKELFIPLVKPVRLRLRSHVEIIYLPLLTSLLFIFKEIARSDLVHIFAGGEAFSVIFQVIAKLLGKPVLVTFHGYRPLELYHQVC